MNVELRQLKRSRRVYDIPVADINDLYTAPAGEVNYDMLRDFVLAAEEANLLAESLTLELKEKRNNDNVALAVAALANTDGGLVLVGVSERAVGEERFVGISQSDRDALITQFHSLIPGDVPEEISVRIPGTDKLVVILRVDADSALRPVVVNGRVVFRLPGQRVSADRQRIISLVEAARVPDRTPAIDVYTPQLHARDMPLWEEPQNRAFVTSRIVGGVTLPGRILDRPWLPTLAKDAAIEALKASPVPEGLWGQSAGPHFHGRSDWRTTKATATTISMVCNPWGQAEQDRVPVSASAYMSLSGRVLSLLLGIRIYVPKATVVQPMRLEHLYAAVFGGLFTIASVCERVATALDAREPYHVGNFEGWIQHTDDYALTSVIDCSGYGRDNDDHPSGGWFPPARPRSASLDDLDRLAREWITVLLLDMGLRDFEEDLEQFQRPVWV